MIRWLVVLAVVGWFGGACERKREPAMSLAPKVGDRSAGSLSIHVTMAGPDGATHEIESRLTTEYEVLELDGDYPIRHRLTFKSDEHSFDGKPGAPGMTGTFEVHESAGGLSITRVGGTITPEESALIAGSWHATRAGAVAKRNMLARTFHVGDAITLSPDEATGWGFTPDTHVALVVREVAATSLTFAIELNGPVPGASGLTLRMTGTLRVTPNSRDLEQEGEISDTAKHATGKARIIETSHGL